MDEIAPASNKARILMLATIVVLGLGVFFREQLFGWIGPWLTEDPDLTLQRFDMLMVGLAACSLPLAGAGAFTIRTGVRAVNSQRFPPEGMWLVANTKIERGRPAVRRGFLMQVGGVLMILVAIGFPIALWYIVHSIAASP